MWVLEKNFSLHNIYQVLKILQNVEMQFHFENTALTTMHGVLS